MKKINLIIFVFFLIFNFSYLKAESTFDEWKVNFKIYAQEQGISLTTINKLIDKDIQ